MWDPRQYEIYATYRGRPFGDLVGRVGAANPARIVDLGCGTGALTATLLDRWPDARVLGLDSSAEMLAEAMPRSRPPRLTFRRGDVRTWAASRGDEPDTGPVDVIVCNAVLQWVPGHADLLPDLVAALADEGWLAFSVPGNFAEPSHTLLAELRGSARWRDLLADLPADLPTRQPAVLDPADYLDRLARLGCQVDSWETTYQHVLTGPDPVLEWVRGTALRPVLAALGPADAEEFTGQYATLLRAAYPARDHGTVLPFRRIFAVAQR